MAQAAMIVEVEVTVNDLYKIADITIDDIYDNEGSDAIRMLGYDKKSLREELVTYPPFLKMIRDCVREYGREALDDSDYLFFETVFETREFKQFFKVAREMAKILDDAYRESTNKECDRCIETLRQSGYKVIKA